MGRALVVIRDPADRQKIARWAMGVPKGTRVEFKETKRSLPQNDKFWAMLTEVSEQVVYHGHRLTPDSWKLVFLDALKREHGEQLRLVPNIDGTGFVNLSTSSSDLSVGEMSEIIEIIQKFGAEQKVVFRDLESEEAA